MTYLLNASTLPIATAQLPLNSDDSLPKDKSIIVF